MAILLCYDGSASAQRAVAVAHQTLGHAAITLLHVWSAPMGVLADASFGTTSAGTPSVVELERLSLERAQTVAQEGHDFASGLDLAVETRIERSDGSVWQTILDVAAEMDAEMVVIGTRGTTAVQSLLLGSVSNAVVHHANRPVLVVPAAAR